MSSIEIFGHTVPISSHVCSSFGAPPTPVTDPYVNLYVRLTSLCPASCAFCVAHGDDSRQFDHDGFKIALAEIYGKAWIKKVAITGGEPTLRIGDLEEVVRTIKSLDPGIVVDLNTNGYHLGSLGFDTLDNLGSISLSRHHWDDSMNSTTFGRRSSLFSTQDIRWFSHKHKLHLRCNLIRGFVDSKDAVLEYMRTFATIGVHDFGFVALMPLNDYCQMYSVTPQEIGLMGGLPGSLLTKHWDKPSGSCSCRNFVMDVLGNGMPVRYYTRYESKPETCVASSLVWDVNSLTLGFGGPAISSPK